MKLFYSLSVSAVLVASTVEANVGDIDAIIEEVKASAVVIAQPEHITTQAFASGDSCVLPLTHLVAIPNSFEGAGEVVVACVSE